MKIEATQLNLNFKYAMNNFLAYACFKYCMRFQTSNLNSVSCILSGNPKFQYLQHILPPVFFLFQNVLLFFKKKSRVL